jgi:hypothetical protein
MSLSKAISMNNYNGDSRSAEHVIREIREVLVSLEQERREIVKKICAIKQTIIGLGSVYGDEIFDNELLELLGRKNNRRRSGLTKTCRMVLIQAGRPLSAREVCEQIMSQSPLLLVSHKDPMASVNTLLTRLADYGEARMAADETGKRTWQWVTSAAEPPLTHRTDIH